MEEHQSSMLVLVLLQQQKQAAATMCYGSWMLLGVMCACMHACMQRAS
jgi:hypothetical protein